jgi:hypothetical protein
VFSHTSVKWNNTVKYFQYQSHVCSYTQQNLWEISLNHTDYQVRWQDHKLYVKQKWKDIIPTLFWRDWGILEQLISWPRFHQACSVECYSSTSMLRKFKCASTHGAYNVVHQHHENLLANLHSLLGGTKGDKHIHKAWNIKLLFSSLMNYRRTTNVRCEVLMGNPESKMWCKFIPINLQYFHHTSNGWKIHTHTHTYI